MTEINGIEQWHRSTRCETGACVEVAAIGDAVMIQNSTDPCGKRLSVSRERWSAFIRDLKKKAA